MKRQLVAGMLAAVLVIAGAALPSITAAADWKIGGGVGAAPDYEGSDDYDAVPMPYFSVQWPNGRNIQWIGNVLRANLIADSIWSAGPMLQFIPERDDVDSNAVDAMEDVDDSLMLGAYARLKLDEWYLRLHAVQDVADGNDGLLVQLGGGYNWTFSPTFKMTFDAFTTYASDDYMEAYFEVDERDAARSGLDRYKADGGLKDVGLGLTTNCNPWAHWNFQAILRYTRLVGDAEDSPVVDDEGDANQYFGGLMVVYEF